MSGEGMAMGDIGPCLGGGLVLRLPPVMDPRPALPRVPDGFLRGCWLTPGGPHTKRFLDSVRLVPTDLVFSSVAATSFRGYKDGLAQAAGHAPN